MIGSSGVDCLLPFSYGRGTVRLLWQYVTVGLWYEVPGGAGGP